MLAAVEPDELVPKLVGLKGGFRIGIDDWRSGLSNPLEVFGCLSPEKLEPTRGLLGGKVEGEVREGRLFEVPGGRFNEFA